ncbi:MAG: hypothetical protein ACI3T9_06020 [Romboutsia timonensis]
MTNNKIVPDIIAEIANNIYVENKKMGDVFSIYNVLLAKSCSAFASKNIMTDSTFHVEPCCLSYYGVNFVSSGFSKNSILKSVNKLYDWLVNEYDNKNIQIKNEYVERQKKRKENKSKTSEELYDEFDDKKRVLVTEVQKATGSSIYDNANLIAHNEFGSIFFCETEFEMAFNNAKVLKTSFNDLYDLLFNLWDGSVDYTDRSTGKQRRAIKNISTSACFLTSYEKLLKEGALRNVFFDYLTNGFARRIFLYISKFNNPNLEKTEEYTLDEIRKAKKQVTNYSHILKKIYDNIQPKTIYLLSKESEDRCIEISKILKKYCLDNFSYANELTPIDKLLNIDINGAVWKIIKLAFLFNFFEGGNNIVKTNCIDMAYNYFWKYHTFLKQFLTRKIQNNFDEYKIFILKNLDNELTLNGELRDGFKIRPNEWKNFKKNILPDFIEELANDNIYCAESKIGRTDYVTFYKKEA